MIYSYLILDCVLFYFFFFNDTATTEIYTLSLHDALPICWTARLRVRHGHGWSPPRARRGPWRSRPARSEEHTSELQSRRDLVCRLLLEKKKKNKTPKHKHHTSFDHYNSNQPSHEHNLRLT